MPMLRPVPLIVAIIGCAAPVPEADVPDVVLTVEPAQVAPGDSVTVQLTTTLGDGVGYNLCSSTLERRIANDWQAVPSDRICTMELRTLVPGDTARFTFRLSVGLEPGEYRYHIRVLRSPTDEMRDVSSGVFRVE